MSESVEKVYFYPIEADEDSCLMGDIQSFMILYLPHVECLYYKENASNVSRICPCSASCLPGSLSRIWWR